MQIQFDPNQPFQLDAIEAVVGLLDGQPRLPARPDFEFGATFGAIGNRLDLTDADLLANLQKVQAAHRPPTRSASPGR